jgi:hypothetical protein
VGIRLFARVVSLITGERVTDPTSGFRMTNRRGIELFARDYPVDYPEVEAILLMHAHRLQSCEIPVLMRPRLTGSSTISSTQSVYYMIKVLLAVFVGLFRARPSAGPLDRELAEGESVERELVEGESLEGESLEGELVEGESLERQPVDASPTVAERAK